MFSLTYNSGRAFLGTRDAIQQIENQAWWGFSWLLRNVEQRETF